MKRSFSMILSLIFILTALTACGDTEKSGAGHSFSYALVGNPDTLDPQLAVNSSAKTVLANLFEGLFTLDDNGTVQKGIVKDYRISDDCLRYSFDLRQDSYWYRAVGDLDGFDKDAAEKVTAADFVFAFQRMFDPVYQSPYRETFSSILHAREIMEGRQDPSMIGVYARRDDLLEIELEKPDTSLLMKLAETAALPCNQDYFQQTKGRYGLDEQSVIGNGSFSMQRWLYDPYGKYNVIQLIRNPLNHAVQKIYPTDISFFIEETDADAIRIFTDGNADCCVTTQADLLPAAAAEAEGSFSLTLGIVANPASDYGKFPAVMQAMRSALDYSKIASQSDLLPASGILPPASVLLNKSCRELISDITYRQHDPEKGRQLLSSGLSSLPRTELPEGKVLVQNGMMDYSALRDVLKQWEDTLSIHLSLEEVVPAEYEKRISNAQYDLALITVSGDNHDPSSVMENFLYAPGLHCTEQNGIRRCLEDASQAQDLTTLVDLYSKAEAAVLKDSCVIPLFYKKRFLVCKKDIKDVHFNPFSSQVQFRDAKYFG